MKKFDKIIFYVWIVVVTVMLFTLATRLNNHIEQNIEILEKLYCEKSVKNGR